MDVKEKIDDLLEMVRYGMPSDGTWPVTVMKLQRSEIEEGGVSGGLNAKDQLLFMIREDFTFTDMLDFVVNTAEYQSLDFAEKHVFLKKSIEENLSGPRAFGYWIERIADECIRLAIEFSESLDLCMEQTDVELDAIDERLQLYTRDLKPFKLFDIYACGF